MNDIIEIIKSLEDSGVLIDGVTKTVKHLALLAASLVQPVISSLVKGISVWGVIRSGKGYVDKNF